ncbi:30S ribosomal protein THX [Spirosoma migulaei]
MGKGDIKSRKGKIARGSYGISRPRVVAKTTAPKSEISKPEPEAQA